MENIKYELIRSFQSAISWCEGSEFNSRKDFSQRNWNKAQVLEHITLSNQYLINVLNEWEKEEVQAEFYSGLRGPFTWPHPERLEPGGKKNLQDLKNELQQQFAECLQLFGRLKQKDGKCRVAQGLLFLTLHINRHLIQLDRMLEKAMLLKLESDTENENSEAGTILRDAS